MTHLHALSQDALQEHSEWMRRLAHRLVFDSDQVDDLVQDAWAVALHSPPKDGIPLRAWLTGIMKRRAMQGRRQSGNAQAREASAASAEATRSTEDLAACADEQRFLIERVLALPLKYREVLLLRFYEGLAPKDIAARLDQPVGTVKTRTQRGLERLRTELDERHGGNRQKWCLALAPLGAMPTGAKAGAAAGVFGSFAWWKLGTSAAALAMLAFGSLWALRPAELMDLRQVSSPEALGDALFAKAIAAGPQIPVAGTVDSRTAELSEAVADSLLLGVLEDQYGRPVAGAVVRTESPPDENGDPRPGVWYSDSVLSAEDGTFAFEPAEDGEGVYVSASLPGYLQKENSVRLRGDGRTSVVIHELGTTRLEIEVVDVQSRRPVPRFSAFAGAAKTGYPDRVSQWKNVGGGDSVDGQWSHDVQLIPGEELRVYLSSCFGFADRAPHVNVMPTPDGVTKVRFEVSALAEEAAPARQWIEGLAVDDETGEVVPGVSVTVYGGPGEDGEEKVSYAQSFMDGTFRAPIHDLAQGKSLSVEHPRYRTELTPIDGSGSLELRLKGRATLSGQVLGEGGEGLAGAPLLLRSTKLVRGPGSAPRRVHERAFSDEDGRFEFPNLVAGRYMLCVCRGPKDADENALLRELHSVAPGEAKEVTLELARPDRIEVTGTVRPPLDIRPEPDYPLVPVFLPYSNGAWVQAKATGWGFDAGRVDRGRYLVVLVPADDDHTAGPFGLVPDVVVEGFGQARFDFVYPANTVTGRVLGLDGGGHYSVVATPVLPAGFASEFLGTGKLNKLLARIVGADGSFSVPRLAQGPHRLTLFKGETKVASREFHVAGSQTIADWTPVLGD